MVRQRQKKRNTGGGGVRRKGANKTFTKAEIVQANIEYRRLRTELAPDQHQGPFYCYILYNTVTKHTYNGYTNNVERRLRQHNGEIKGGARATRSYRPWIPGCILTGFQTSYEAMSCEWRIRHPLGYKIHRRPKQKKENGDNDDDDDDDITPLPPSINIGMARRVWNVLAHVVTQETWTKSCGCGIGNDNGNVSYDLYIDPQWYWIYEQWNKQLLPPNLKVHPLYLTEGGSIVP